MTEGDGVDAGGAGLPPGWAWAQLGEVVQAARSCSPAREFVRQAGFDYVDLSAVANHRIASPQRIAPASAPSRARQKIQVGDTLFSCVRIYLGNIAQVPASLDGQIASTAFAVLRPTPGMEPDYIYWLARSPVFIGQMIAAQRGNSPPAVQDVDVRNAVVPIPPRNEQVRIAAQVGALFTDLDEAEAALSRARAGLGTYRASLLHAACTGQLTAAWRASRPPPAEDGPALLRRILSERRAAWERAEHARMQARGKLPTGDGWKARYQEPAAPDTMGLPELPEDWAWASVDQLLAEPTRNGISVKGKPEPPGTPALRLDALGIAGLRYDRRRFIEILAAKVSALAITEGDFLVSRANGSLHLVGRGCLASPPPEPTVFPDTMIRLRFVLPSVAVWVSAVWGSSLVRQHIEGRAKTTAGIQKISQDDLHTAVVPLPPEAEMSAVSALLVDGQLSNEDWPSSTILRQSILHAAFAGRLVPQDPTDEPATALLARLRAAPAPSRQTRKQARTP